MASSSRSSLSDEYFNCPVCFDIFKDPVLLPCSHSYCKVCLQQCWEAKGFRECPVCRKRFSMGNPPCNLALKNLCEAYLEGRTSAESKVLCSLHDEKFKLYCLEDKQPICLVCQSSRQHKGHDCCPIDEAVQDLKDKGELQRALKPLQEKLKVFKEATEMCTSAMSHIQRQFQDTKMEIKHAFEEFQQFLRDEEKASIDTLREEEFEKTSAMGNRIDQLRREMSSLVNTIEAIEDELRAEDTLFLQNYKTIIERAQCTLPDPDTQLVSGALIDVVKHLGNLQFKAWEKMQRNGIVTYRTVSKKPILVSSSLNFFMARFPCIIPEGASVDLVEAPVILDPNTAHPQIVLSDGLTIGTYFEHSMHLPDNPERFDKWPSVLGSEGFESGLHTWDVVVGENEEWMLGVLSEAALRKGEVKTRDQSWGLTYLYGTYIAFSPPNDKILLTVDDARTIRVQLDWDKGTLSFSNPDNATHIHTFTHTFTERVFPHLGNNSKYPLTILPGEVTLVISPVKCKVNPD